MPDDNRLLLNIADACSILGLSKARVERLVDERKLRQVRIGPRLRRITRASIDAYVESLDTPQPAWGQLHCVVCGQPIIGAKRSTAKYCSTVCRAARSTESKSV